VIGGRDGWIRVLQYGVLDTDLHGSFERLDIHPLSTIVEQHHRAGGRDGGIAWRKKR